MASEMVDMQLHSGKPGVQEINPIVKKMGIAMLVLQGVMFCMLLAVCIVAGQTQSKIAQKLPIIEEILDNYAVAAKFFHSSMPDVTQRMLTSDKKAAMKAVNLMADKTFSVFNNNRVQGASEVAKISSMVRSWTSATGLMQVQDVCPAAGGSLCPTSGSAITDSDIISIPAYITDFLTKQADVAKWKNAGKLCSVFFQNLQSPNLAGSYQWSEDGVLKSETWDFNSAKSTFADIVQYCNLIAALPV
jgi:hypothetical protein